MDDTLELGDETLDDHPRLALDAAGVIRLEGQGVGIAIVKHVLEHDATTERAFDVDMTNWSVVVDERWVAKVGRTWGALERAARQSSRLAGVGVIPEVRGMLEWQHPERGMTVAAIVSDLVPHATDGWTWAVDDVQSWLAGGPRPTWPAALGALTARMHDALRADPTGQPAAPGESVRARASGALCDALAATDGAPGVRLRNRVPAIEAAIASVPDATNSPAFDIHGDLHVGQVLRSESRYLVLDFDGDPQLDAAQRDAPDVAARDVAHLMSSVEMVAAVVHKQHGKVDDRVIQWAIEAQREVLDAYCAHGGVLDQAQLAGMHAEQLLRELVYADRFLPRWQYAADAAITFRFPPDPGSEEEAWTPPASSTT